MPIGTLVADINPATFALADNTPLTFANSGLTPVTGSPTLKLGMFDKALPAIKILRTTQGFSIPRPVQDDFTIYLVCGGLVGGGAGTQFWSNGSLIDCEAAGGFVDDFAINLRADGLLSVGTGNGDTTATGTHVVTGPGVHFITVTRKRSTGTLKVWLDGVLDVTLVHNVNSLTAQPNLYCGSGTSGEKAGGYIVREQFYDATHDDSERIAHEADLAVLYADDPDRERVTKALSYLVSGVPRTDLALTKGATYALLGPGVFDRVAVSKAILYGVLGFQPALAVTKGMLYAVLGPPEVCGYDGVIMECADRPISNVFAECMARPDSAADGCGPNGGDENRPAVSFTPSNPIERCR